MCLYKRNSYIKPNAVPEPELESEMNPNASSVATYSGEEEEEREEVETKGIREGEREVACVPILVL